jgi:cytochrome b involved in lipid metabolism
MSSSVELPVYSKDQVSTHNSEESMWIIIHGFVLDVTSFILDHPGGAKTLKKYAGKDASDAFEALFHSERARKMAKNMTIGKILS